MDEETFGDPTVGSSRDDAVGTTIGRYRILQVIGEGGFGTVYAAEQTEPVRRRVALKIIKLGMDTNAVIARFEAEGQALALMDHPGIAKVFDAGATDSGRPYFVMELVKGVAITAYCDTENLSTTERLRLFVEVCHAVQHAHQKGIIHRDIKPSNVLVAFQDGRPVPKIIDFGIAKATSRHLTEKSMFTELGQIMGTPAYMSPEQAEMTGLDIDTRSDIYSLGVLLYELLTGTTPFDGRRLRQAGFGEICRIIREVDPPRPSTRLGELTTHGHFVTTPESPTLKVDVTPFGTSGTESLEEIAKHRRAEPAQLTRLVRGDLDWIVMRALEKNRTRRYETANGFAMDIERYLADEPVLASPPTAGYRLRKFVRRHRGLVTALVVVFATLAAGVTGTTIFLVRARAAERVAVEERRSVEKLLTFILGDLKGELEPIGRLDALDGAARQVVDYYARRPASELDGEDLLQYAQGLELAGKTQLSRAELAAAESAFREEVKLLDELLRKEPGNTECLFWLGQAHFYLGAVAYRQDDPDAALAGFDRYLELAERLSRRDPNEAKWRLEVAYANSSRATLLEAMNRRDEAARARNRVIEIKRELLERDPDNRDYLLALANELTFIADAASGRCDNAGALAAAAEAHDLIRDFAAAHRDDLDVAHRLNVARSKHAMYMDDGGDHESALRLLRQNQETARRLVETEPDNTRWLHERAAGFQLAGRALLRLGRTDEALLELDASRREFDRLIERGSEKTDTVLEYAVTVRWSAEAELAAGRPDRVASLVSEASARLATISPSLPGSRLASARFDVLEARALLARRRTESRPVLERALERVAPAPASAPATAELRATALLLLGRNDEAAPLLETVRGCAGLPAHLAELARAAGLIDEE